ncbi:hypothetical protein N7513_005667 [Penicillium frequentans]|nr:hypothetical protein N7513_005667 [Penicillium glabrum]
MKLFIISVLSVLSSSAIASHPHHLPHGRHGEVLHSLRGKNQETALATSTTSAATVLPSSSTGSIITPASSTPASVASISVPIKSGTPTTTGTPTTSGSSSTWVHPGVFLSSSQMSYFSSKVSISEQPWATAWIAMTEHEFATRTTPTPYATVECGPYSTPDVGCTNEVEDALTAYLNALAWVVTGLQTHADLAITFMNGWSSTVKNHTGSNGPLQAGWAASSWSRAAEIIRYTDAGWSDADITTFEDMLRDVYLPAVIPGSEYMGNWELVMMEAALGISVFIENRTSYDIAMEKFLTRAAAYIYLTSDGDLPNAIDESTEEDLIEYWFNQTTFVDGIGQETCRDFGHMGYGIASISHVLETSRIQGRDLYTEEVGSRLQYALDFHTTYENGAAVPSWLCDGSVTLGIAQVTEPGLNGLSYRLGYAMNQTEVYTVNDRPEDTNIVFVGWETLTHAMNPA